MTDNPETPEPDLTLRQRWAEWRRLRPIRKKRRKEKKQRSKGNMRDKKR